MRLLSWGISADESISWFPRDTYAGQKAPGVCIPWEEKQRELPTIRGDAVLVKRIWEDTDALAHTYIWQCLLSF